MIVVLCHFVLAFQPGFLSGDPAHGGPVAALLARTPAILLWNPEFGFAVFFVLSGTVLAASAEATRLSLPALLVRRWLRLALPILGSSALIWCLVEAGGLRNAVVAAANGSEWLAAQFAWLAFQSNDPGPMARQSLFDIFITRTHWWNQALWTMPIEFIGSVGVFVGAVLLRRFGGGRRSLLIAALLAATVLRATPYAEFAAGVALFAATRRSPRQDLSRLGWCGGALLALGAVLAGGMPWALGTSGLYLALFTRLSDLIAAPLPVVHGVGAVLAVACVLVWLPARATFASAVARRLGSISFMVYLCHIALLCSVGAWVVLGLSPSLGYDGATAMALVCVLAALLPIATVMTLACDQPAIMGSRLAGVAIDRAGRAAFGAVRSARARRASS